VLIVQGHKRGGVPKPVWAGERYMGNQDPATAFNVSRLAKPVFSFFRQAISRRMTIYLYASVVQHFVR